jgi:hypothetical protein
MYGSIGGTQPTDSTGLFVEFGCTLNDGGNLSFAVT